MFILQLNQITIIKKTGIGKYEKQVEELNKSVESWQREVVLDGEEGGCETK